MSANVAEGKFGIWEETGFNINLALVAGAYHGLGYGEAVGALIENEGVELPDSDDLAGEAARLLASIRKRRRLRPTCWAFSSSLPWAVDSIA